LPDAASQTPLVSIICFCKDRATTIRRSVDSVLSQDYPHFELVVQDGASTDGTLEILQAYGDPRIKIVSEPDSGPAEAFWKVMNRCQGDYIGTCLSDEELLPGVIQMAVDAFHREPWLGAITCDGYITDPSGRITGEFNAGEFDLVDYLFGAYCPFWPGSFFSRQALVDVGLHTHPWTIECLEFETWCRLGTLHRVRHLPIRVAKYAVHPTQLSNTARYFHEHFDHRARVIRAMFSDAGFFGRDDVKMTACLYNQLYLLYNHVRAYKMTDEEARLAARMRELVARVPQEEYAAYRARFDFLDRPLAAAHDASTRDRPGFSPALYADVADAYARHGYAEEAERLRRKAALTREAAEGE
jgi:glycosyltransferase involved in cell wall biosynthesis